MRGNVGRIQLHDPHSLRSLVLGLSAKCGGPEFWHNLELSELLLYAESFGKLFNRS